MALANSWPDMLRPTAPHGGQKQPDFSWLLHKTHGGGLQLDSGPPYLFVPSGLALGGFTRLVIEYVCRNRIKTATSITKLTAPIATDTMSGVFTLASSG